MPYLDIYISTLTPLPLTPYPTLTRGLLFLACFLRLASSMDSELAKQAAVIAVPTGRAGAKCALPLPVATDDVRQPPSPRVSPSAEPRYSLGQLVWYSDRAGTQHAATVINSYQLDVNYSSKDISSSVQASWKSFSDCFYSIRFKEDNKRADYVPQQTLCSIDTASNKRARASGAEDGNKALACDLCKGSGVCKETGSSEAPRCRSCQGTGLQESHAFPCLLCSGVGFFSHTKLLDNGGQVNDIQNTPDRCGVYMCKLCHGHGGNDEQRVQACTVCSGFGGFETFGTTKYTHYRQLLSVPSIRPDAFPCTVCSGDGRAMPNRVPCGICAGLGYFEGSTSNRPIAKHSQLSQSLKACSACKGCGYRVNAV